MKTLISLFALTFALSALAAPNWVQIPTVATNCPNPAEWNDFTDFVPDFDPSPDGFLYLKLFYNSSVPWDYAGGNAGGYTYVFRVLPNLSVNSYNGQWQQVIRFAANTESGHKVALCKRGGAFFGPNFAGMGDIGGGWDWSWFTYWTTNAAGDPAIPGHPSNGKARIARPGNKHPYSVAHIAGFPIFNSHANYYGIGTSADETGDSIANIELRYAAHNTSWGTANTVVRKTTDNKYKAWSRGFTYKNNIYFWKGPSSDTTQDGVWVVTNVIGNSDLNSISQCVANAYLLIPVSSMDANANTWDTSDACGIVAFEPSENYLGLDLLVVSANVGGGTILAFDLANPTSGPVTLWSVQNIFPSGAESQRLQLGKAGRFLFVLKGSGPTSRVLYRLDMLGLSATDPEVDVTTPNQNVSSSTTSLNIQGTSAGSVAAMWYVNELTAQTGPITVAANWSVNVALGMGANLIKVYGSNSIGIVAIDDVAITRQDPGQGTPSVTIANGNAQIFSPASTYNLQGTANPDVMGFIWWSNTTAGTAGTTPATSSWSVVVSGLITGDNNVVVYGTNLLNQQASASTKIYVGYNYFVDFTANEIGLPPGIGTRGRNASMGSDGTNIFVCRCVAGAPIFRFPWNGTSSNEWVAGAAFPALNSDNETGDGFGYYNGALYTFAQLYSGWRSAVRYNIAADSWSNGNNEENGANTSCVLDDVGNLYGGWRGWDQIEKQNPFPGLTEIWQSGLGGGANHSWDSTRSPSTIYFMKGWGTLNNGRIYSMPADGSANGTFTFVTETPWPIGLGCAIEYVPAAFSRYSRPELWVLRGQGDGATSDGQGGNPTPDLAIYDLDHGVWTRYTLDEPYEEGSDMAFANGWMFLMNGGNTGGNFAKTQTIPEPAAVGAVLLALLALRKRS